MKNNIVNIALTNASDAFPREMRGIRYEFANDWAASVIGETRGGRHEVAVLDETGRIVYFDEGLLYLTPQEVLDLLGIMGWQDTASIKKRISRWVDHISMDTIVSN